MSEYFSSNPDDMRRRKLDELFADEPFLSATMKARRLHEFKEKEAALIEAAKTPSSAGEVSMPLPEEDTVSLKDAAHFLRGNSKPYGMSQTAVGRLIQLRDLLNRWLDELPKSGKE